MSTGQQIGLIGSSVRVQSLPTASAATFGEGNRFYTLIGQQEGYITGHTYRTVVANDVYSWEDVRNELMLLALVDGTITANSSIEVALSNFNRQPLVDNLLIVYSNANQYALMKVSAVTSTAATLIVKDNSAANIVSTKGETGAAGVGITNAIAGEPIVADGKTTTPITFSLSDGTTKEVQVEAQNGNDGKDGAQGATGKDALVYRVLEDTILKKDKTLGLFYEDKLNRIPVVNDTLLIVGSGNQYCIGTVTRVNTITKACDIQCGTVVSTKGDTGATGPQGPQGIGVKSITSGTPTVVNDKTNTPITITLTDNTTVDLVVSAENGKDGTSGTVDIVQATGQSTTAVMSQKAVTDELNKKVNSADLSTVATSGNYNDLSNKPTIPTDYVPNTRKVNNKALSSDITLGASDVGALPTAGGTVTGNLTVGGNLTVNGTTTTVDSTTLQVKDKLIEVAHGNTATLTTPAGLVAPKYDGTNSGALVFNGDGIASVGDVVLDASGNIDVIQSNLQPLATRTGLVNDNLVKYDGTNQTLVDTGKKISDLATAAQVNAKQNALTKTQLAAVDSGITEAKRTKYDGYEEIINQKANSADLAKVATSGSYNDLSNKPAIPTDYVKYTEQTLTDAQKSQARSNIGAGTSDFDGTWGSLSGKPNVVQSIGNSTSDVMSQKAVTDELAKKATTAQVEEKYKKPDGGIPKSDLATSVQTSLDKADSALQSAPVTSVNGKTGAVQLGAGDVGALPSSTKFVSSVNGKTGAVTGLATQDEVNAKQNALTETQLEAVNSGVTQAKITKYDGYDATIKQKVNVSDLATVATSGSYNDLSDTPTIPAAANNGTLTIQKNGTDVATFGANQSTNTTANIIVPTKVSDLTNDSGYTTNNGTVTQVKINEATKFPNSEGLVDLGTGFAKTADLPIKSASLSGTTLYLTL